MNNWRLENMRGGSRHVAREASALYRFQGNNQVFVTWVVRKPRSRAKKPQASPATHARHDVPHRIQQSISTRKDWHRWHNGRAHIPRSKVTRLLHVEQPIPMPATASFQKLTTRRLRTTAKNTIFKGRWRHSETLVRILFVITVANPATNW
jgi:hypothetical protein